jgi:hypothetical protein
MQSFLNLTLPLKQDDASQAALQQLLGGFNEQLEAVVEEALAKSKIVHFARFIVLGTKYIQILTTYDGDEHEYAMFFWNELNPVFKAAYELVEGAPTGDNWTVDNFLAFNAIPVHQPVPFYRFSAYPEKTVEDINGVE